LGDTTNRKVSYGRKESHKIGGEVGSAAIGVKAASETAEEETENYELAVTLARFTRLVIGSALKKIARW
jgi:hypothetical protein